MKKVLLVLTSADEIAGEPTGYTLSEAAHPWKIFRDAGHVVDFASIAGGTPPVDPNSERDEITDEFESDATVQAGLANTAKVEFVEADQYDAIYLVGGHGTMVDFRGNEHLARLVKTLADTGAVVSAVCHGPSGLLDVELANGLRIVEGRKVAAFTDDEEAELGKTAQVPFLLSSELEAQGATLVPAENWAENVVVDGLLVTGQNPASAAGVAKEVVKILTTLVREEKAEEEAAAEELRAEKDAEKEAAETEKEKPASE
ncbi:type 1 glutamine amidotransferase domain-containing protein [Luteococcus sediminum]